MLVEHILTRCDQLPSREPLVEYKFRRFDPYPQYTDLATRWAIEHVSGGNLFGRLIDPPPHNPGLIKDLTRILDGFETKYDRVLRVIVNDDDRAKYPLLCFTTAWSKNIVLSHGNKYSFHQVPVIFYSDSVKDRFIEIDEHEVLHLAVDHSTENSSGFNEPIMRNGYDYNRIVYPGFSTIRRLADMYREGMVLLLESEPVKMSKEEIEQFIMHNELETIHDFEELCSIRHKAHLPNTLYGKFFKEYIQHVMYNFVMEVMTDSITIVDLGYEINTLGQGARTILIALKDITKRPLYELMVDGNINRQKRRELFREYLTEYTSPRLAEKLGIAHPSL